MDTVTVCYRHPDRETYLRCASCDRPICPECSIDTPAGQKCPECARPAARQVAYRQWMSRPTPVTYTIMALAIGVHVGRFLLPDVFDPLVTDMAQANWLVAAGEWWRLLTAAFLHADAMHLLFNMWALYIFGPQLERELGGVTFTSLYLASAATGGAAAYFLGGDFDVLVGASGAIFGLFGVWLVGSWRIRHTRAGSALYRQLIVLLAINAALPLFARNISWQGHLGGLAAGALMAFAWARIPADRRRGPLRTVIATAIGLVAIFFTVLL